MVAPLDGSRTVPERSALREVQTFFLRLCHPSCLQEHGGFFVDILCPVGALWYRMEGEILSFISFSPSYSSSSSFLPCRLVHGFPLDGVRSHRHTSVPQRSPVTVKCVANPHVCFDILCVQRERERERLDDESDPFHTLCADPFFLHPYSWTQQYWYWLL